MWTRFLQLFMPLTFQIRDYVGPINTKAIMYVIYVEEVQMWAEISTTIIEVYHAILESYQARAMKGSMRFLSAPFNFTEHYHPLMSFEDT